MIPVGSFSRSDCWPIIDSTLRTMVMLRTTCTNVLWINTNADSAHLPLGREISCFNDSPKNILMNCQFLCSAVIKTLPELCEKKSQSMPVKSFVSMNEFHMTNVPNITNDAMMSLSFAGAAEVSSVASIVQYHSVVHPCSVHTMNRLVVASKMLSK